MLKMNAGNITMSFIIWTISPIKTGVGHFTFLRPSFKIKILQNYRNSLLTVRERKKFWRPNGNFWVHYKNVHLQRFWLCPRESASFCHFNALNSNPSWTSRQQRLTTFHWNRFRHLYWFFKSVMSVKPIKGVYFKAKGKFPESRTQTAGDRNKLIELKNCRTEKLLLQWYVKSYTFQVFWQIWWQRKVKLPIQVAAYWPLWISTFIWPC